MTPRPIAFTGRTTAIAFGLHAIIRITPSLQAVGQLPPIPPTESTVLIDTPAGQVAAFILASARDRLLIRANGKSWGLSPLRPNEIDGVASYPEGSGATDWVIRAEG